MDAERKQEYGKLDDGNDKGAGLQKISPQAGNLRLACRGVKYRDQGIGNRE
jgi:hypothetical protein